VANNNNNNNQETYSFLISRMIFMTFWIILNLSYHNFFFLTSRMCDKDEKSESPKLLQKL
jgi:hypothetical protein